MQDAVGDFLLYESVTRKNKSLHPHIHSNACLCEYMSHGDWAHVSAILSQVFDFTSRFYDTYKISHRKRQAVTLLGMRVCVYVYVYVCVRVLVLARARTPNESAYVVPPRQLLIVLHHALQAVFLSSSVICLPVYCTYTCQLETSNIYVLKNQGGDIARSK